MEHGIVDCGLRLGATTGERRGDTERHREARRHTEMLMAYHVSAILGLCFAWPRGSSPSDTDSASSIALSGTTGLAA